MSFATHYRFGYLTQIASLLTLTLVNIALPNWLGVSAFAALNEMMAFVGITCLVFNEGVSYLMIRRVLESGIGFEEAGQMLTQAAFEHFLLAFAVLIGVVVVVDVFGSHHYTTKDWLMIFFAAQMVAAYIPCVALLTATLRNHVVLGLALLNGILNFILPVMLDHFGMDIRFAIILSYGLCFACCIAYFGSQGVSGYSLGIKLKNWMFLRKQLLPLISPTALRIAIIWIPVILFANAGSAVDAATYKIATSIAFGALALVPFNKQTMVSMGNAPTGFAKTVASIAILVAGLGGVLLIGIAEPFTHILYVADYSRLAQFLPAIGPFLVLQIVVDIVLVELISKKKDKLILALCLTAVLIATIALAFLEPRWYPVFCAGLFCALFAVTTPQFFSGQLVSRGIAASLVAVFAAFFIAGWLGLTAGLVTLALALLIDAELRGVAVSAALHLFPARKIGLDR